MSSMNEALLTAGPGGAPDARVRRNSAGNLLEDPESSPTRSVAPRSDDNIGGVSRRMSDLGAMEIEDVYLLQ